MFTQVTLTIGHKVGSVEKLDTATVCNAVTALLGVEAFTALPCVGMWKGQAETSTRIEIVTDKQTARSIECEVPYLSHMLEQEAIMCEVRPCATEFVAAANVAAVA